MLSCRDFGTIRAVLATAPGGFSTMDISYRDRLCGGLNRRVAHVPALYGDNAGFAVAIDGGGAIGAVQLVVLAPGLAGDDTGNRVAVNDRGAAAAADLSQAVQPYLVSDDAGHGVARGVGRFAVGKCHGRLQPIAA